MYKKLSKVQANRLEQRTLKVSLVTLPSDRRFQYGYAHIEPLINSINGLLMLVVCVYAFFNGVEGLRGEGSLVDPASVIRYSLLTGVIGATVWVYEPQRMADLDRLRERIWTAMDRPLDEAWLSICFTADPRWS